MVQTNQQNFKKDEFRSKYQKMELKLKQTYKMQSRSVLLSLFIISTLLLLSCNIKSDAVRIRSIQVPSAVYNGSQVTLVCKFDLQGDQLYSVKWYRNYVEFYRFQPTQSQSSGQTNGSQQSASRTNNDEGSSNNEQLDGLANHTDSSLASSSIGEASSWINNQATSNGENWPTPDLKQEFELDGINLSLQGSNATHVHLRQVSLSSEGKYKCEVSSDLPSFVTVSAEHEMKVYALPKTRLTIMEQPPNWLPPDQRPSRGPPILAPAAGGAGAAMSNQQQQQQQAQVAIPTSRYQLHDLINLTCISSPSYPIAQLSWLLEGKPIGLNGFLESELASPGGLKEWGAAPWFRLSQSIAAQRGSGSSSGAANITNSNSNHHDNSLLANQQHRIPLETRLTLSFRLEPKLLAYLARFGERLHSPMSINSNNINKLQQPNSIFLAKFSCRAKISLLFQSQSSAMILPAGQQVSSTGNNNKRSSVTNKPESLPDRRPDELQDDEHDWDRQREDSNWQQNQDSESNNNDNHQASSDSIRMMANSIRPNNFLNSMEQLVLAGSNDNQRDGSNGLLLLVAGSRHLASISRWSRRELQEHFEMISSRLKAFQPNELENPIIEMSTIIPPSEASTLVTTTQTQPYSYTEQNPSNSELGPTSQAAKDSGSVDETVELVCRAQLRRPLQLSSLERRLQNQAIRINSKWLINGQEVILSRLNDFDNSRGFTYSTTSEQQQAQRLVSGPSPEIRMSNHRRVWSTRPRVESRTSSTVNETASLSDSPPWSDSTKLDGEEHDYHHQAQQNKLKHVTNNQNKNTTHRSILEEAKRSLSIEISPSLLRLKEIQIRCQTFIEYPLIVYESPLLIGFQMTTTTYPQTNQHAQDGIRGMDSSTSANSPIGQIARGYLTPSSRSRNQSFAQSSTTDPNQPLGTTRPQRTKSNQPIRHSSFPSRSNGCHQSDRVYFRFISVLIITVAMSFSANCYVI